MNIYADNAATTKLDKDAFEAMKPFMLECYANASQPYSFSKKAKQALNEARNTIAACINAEPEEILFTSGGTESDNWAIIGSALADTNYHATITSQIEHHAILKSCEAIERLRFPVAYMPVDCTGTVQPDTLERFITNKTRLVSVMLANNEIGTIQPIKELVKIAHSYGSFVHTDAVQAVGHIPIDVKKLGIDMLSASAHKFNGPKGIGFLFHKKNIPLKPFHNGGSQEFEMRAGTENIAAIVGMAVSLKNNTAKLDNNISYLDKISSTFLDVLKKANIDFVLNGHPDNRLPGNINISINGKSGEGIMHMLDLKGICISTGSACDSKNQSVSHVINAIKVPVNYAKGTIRVTFGIDNTEQEAIYTAKAIAKVVNL